MTPSEFTRTVGEWISHSDTTCYQVLCLVDIWRHVMSLSDSSFPTKMLSFSYNPRPWNEFVIIWGNDNNGPERLLYLFLNQIDLEIDRKSQVTTYSTNSFTFLDFFEQIRLS